jgi:hypothetical protein
VVQALSQIEQSLIFWTNTSEDLVLDNFEISTKLNHISVGFHR